MAEQELKELTDEFVEVTESRNYWMRESNKQKEEIKMLKLQLECVLIAYKQLKGEDND